MLHVLGLSAYYHDAAAALIRDGQIVAAAQEERFTRRKHDPDFPAKAIAHCLDAGDVALRDLDAVVFYDKPMLKFERLLESYLGNAPRGFASFRTAVPVWIREKLNLKGLLRKELAALGGLERRDLPTLLFTEHHQSHAASAFFPSPFERAAVLCMDGVGEWATTSVWLGDGATLTPLWDIHFPHSLGLLYSAFTYYCGFRVNSGEYKLMGLAPYGEPRHVDTILEHLIDVKDDGTFALDLSYFDYVTGLRMTNDRFADLFGAPARDPDSVPDQTCMDLARSIQVVTEEIVLRLARTVKRDTDTQALCLAGGVALNCVANGRLRREGPYNDLWIQPAAGDAGGAPGAALMAAHQYFDLPRTPNGRDDAMRGAYLGPAYTTDVCETQLGVRGARWQAFEDDRLFEEVAARLARGEVIGWFQGAMEFGPRALGNRSILGDPRSASMQSRMNLKIKNRESFRPFAPAVLAERVASVFEMNHDSPYMLHVANLRDGLRRSVDPELVGFARLKQPHSTLPAITHVDGSARVQTVHAETNPRFHRLISAFDQLTGVPLLINTSFNVRGEPIVCTPDDAYRCFMATDMDTLVVANLVLDKNAQPDTARQWARSVTFAPD